MDQGVAAVVAAAVAGIVAVTGSFVGVWVGRRQVQDQAKVEHGQWLRGQRQEAFVDFLAVWDATVGQLAGRMLNLYEIEQLDNEDGWDAAGELNAEELHHERLPVARAGERVVMLGPESVAVAAAGMLDAIDALAAGVGAQFRDPSGRPGHGTTDGYHLASNSVAARRKEFVELAATLLQTAPDAKSR
ncbi:hypothetical protein [Kitasatospora sp. NPDC088346]|uniref:hypothetical protein n=1 Tax=Kitasatospora sp. NPDC088346 TaxID=3364073 RepID=UPI00381935A8